MTQAGRNTIVTIALTGCILLVVGGALLTLQTARDLQPVSVSLKAVLAGAQNLQVTDRHGVSLAVTRETLWNTHDNIPLHEMPEFLQQAIVVAEDKRFYHHDGQDWLARLTALWQNALVGRAVRGASTITEQVVRIIHPRPRTFWSRWIEGWEAALLEDNGSKADILEFYLNQVPYASNRRGVTQAARHYFNRDLDTLTLKEMLALTVLVRAPSRMDMYADPGTIEPPIHRLAKVLTSRGDISEGDFRRILAEPLHLERPRPPVRATHFVRHALRQAPQDIARDNGDTIRTTLDGRLQRTIQAMLDRRLKQLAKRKVHNGAALVVRHGTGEVLAWVIADNNDPAVPGSFIDTVTAARQPGSSLKPFLYAMALESGWSPSTLINDAPLTESVGYGLHSYRNYSRMFYGPVTLREALGNSLNIPALRVIQFVGPERYLHRLRNLGFGTLDKHPSFYGHGLALGNGEVPLFDLVQAYTVFANRGSLLPITLLLDGTAPRVMKQVFSPEVASLIGDILSDPEAKRLEFGTGSVLDHPVQTAVKTGTSSDYRDAWAVGFNHRYTVGVWMGNLDQQPTRGLTGSIGPALLLRTIFAELNKHQKTRSLYVSPRLVQRTICRESGKPPGLGARCSPYTEWFVRGTEPSHPEAPLEWNRLRWRKPTSGLQLAMDPRIPDESEAFEFEIQGVEEEDSVNWSIDSVALGETHGGKYLWPLTKGTHILRATVQRGRRVVELPQVAFVVK